MAHLVTFRTTKFDPQAEPANPINPIPGHGVLVWLSEALRGAGFETGEPDAEDWGWYLDVTGHGATYLVGASADSEPGDKGANDWTIQLHRRRSLTDKLFGLNAHAPDDPLTTIVEHIVRAEPSFEGIDLDRAG